MLVLGGYGGCSAIISNWIFSYFCQKRKFFPFWRRHLFVVHTAHCAGFIEQNNRIDENKIQTCFASVSFSSSSYTKYFFKILAQYASVTKNWSIFWLHGHPYGFYIAGFLRIHCCISSTFKIHRHAHAEHSSRFFVTNATRYSKHSTWNSMYVTTKCLIYLWFKF